MALHNITLTHCEPEKAVGNQAESGDAPGNSGSWYCFACGAAGIFAVELTDGAEDAE